MLLDSSFWTRSAPPPHFDPLSRELRDLASLSAFVCSDKVGEARETAATSMILQDPEAQLS